MRIALDEHGVSIRIVGDEDELQGLVETLEQAMENGSAEGAMLGDAGVEKVRVECDGWEPDGG